MSDTPNARQIAESLALEHGQSLVAYARRLTGSHEWAQDAAQEALAKLCALDPARLSGVMPRLPGWLYAACRSAAIDRFRRERHECGPAAEEPSHQHTPDAAAGASEEQRHMLAALDTLPPREREALILRFLSGLSYADGADAMGIQTATYGWLIHSGLTTLRRRLGDAPTLENPHERLA